MTKALALTALTFMIAGLAQHAHAASPDESSTEAVAPRDAASGLPTGKRQHKPVKTVVEPDESGDASTRATTPRDAASGQATGKRQAMGGDEGAGDGSVVSPRDAASGLPTGKRQHKPVSGSMDDADDDGEADGATKAQDHNSSRSNKSN